MPYIPTIRLGRWLWLAWIEDDFHRRSCPRFGFSEERAKVRCFDASSTEE